MPYRPHISGSMGQGEGIYSSGGNWKGLHSGWGYRKRINGNGGRVQRGAEIKEFLGKDTKPGKTWGFDPFKKGMKTLQNGGTGNGKPVLVHKGEMVIGNPFGRRGGRRP